VPVTGSRELYLSVFDNIKIYHNILEGILKTYETFNFKFDKKRESWNAPRYHDKLKTKFY